MRSGRLLANQDAFRVGVDGQLTLDSVVTQIADKVAELRGHDEGGVEEPLSSFGLTSVSVTELGAFILTQFTYQVSALELMTTASALSLAQAIIHGKKAAEDVEEGQAETEMDGSKEDSRVVQLRVRRVPSAFASAPEGHFPQGAGFE